jgi:hypothetical protein
MLSAGIEIGTDVIKRANNVRDNKADFIVFKIKDRKAIHWVDQFPGSDCDIEIYKRDTDKYSSWPDRVYPRFLSALEQSSEPMYVVLDFKYTVDSRKCSKLFFIGWCPGGASVRDKMLFASTFTQFADTINIPVRITAHTQSDLEYNELRNRV